MMIPFSKTSFFRLIHANKPTIVAVFLKAGLDPNSAVKYGDTALHVAAETGTVEIARLLVQYGADVDVRDSVNLTPLMVAARSGNYDCVELLLRSGADANAADDAGQTSSLLAVAGRRRSPPDSGQAFESAQIEELKVRYYECVKVLIANGADVNARMKGGLGVVDLAELSGQPEIIDLVRAAGAVSVN